MHVAALIPAKGHSRRLPGKNLKRLAGLPLFMHGVRLALETESIEAVYVSSDSNEILNTADGDRVCKLLRPPDLCTDVATNFQVMCHHLGEWRNRGCEPDILVLLQPTTPFRTAHALDVIIRRFAADPLADSLITVTPAARLRGRIEDGYWMPEQRTAIPDGRMQTAEAWHEATGHAIVLRPRRTLDRGSLLGEHVRAEPLPCDWADIDIDTPSDWKLAQAYAATSMEKNA